MTMNQRALWRRLYDGSSALQIISIGQVFENLSAMKVQTLFWYRGQFTAYPVFHFFEIQNKIRYTNLQAKFSQKHYMIFKVS